LKTVYYGDIRIDWTDEEWARLNEVKDARFKGCPLFHDDGYPRGRGRSSLKVTEEQIQEIRALKGRMSGRQIAELYPTSVATVHRILRGDLGAK
jgi:hypothetical protein